MIRRDGHYDIDLRENMRGGTGAVRIEHFWKKDELKSNTRLCARLTLDPGSSIGFHEHADEEEIFVVVSGQARATNGNDVKTLRPGDTLLTGGGAGHAVEATGADPLVLFAVIVQY